MYCYNVGCPLDIWTGLTPVQTYLYHVVCNMKYNCCEEGPEEFEDWLYSALEEAYYSLSNWEGDIWGNAQFCIGALPAGDHSTNRFLVFKQNDNGSTYVVSDAPINQPEWEHESAGGLQKKSSKQWTLALVKIIKLIHLQRS